MVASVSMLSITIDYENEPNMKVAAGNVKIKIHQRDYCTAENLRGLDTNWLLNNV